MQRTIMTGIVWVVILVGSTSIAWAGKFKIIVHTANPTVSLSYAELEGLFLKKTETWPNGAQVQPVDQRKSSAVRVAFSQAVLKKSVAAVNNRWQQRLFSGRGVPPPQKSSDLAVVSFVAANPGAIAYVAFDVDTSRVKVVKVVR